MPTNSAFQNKNKETCGIIHNKQAHENSMTPDTFDL